MLRYVEKVIIPYVNRIRDDMPLGRRQTALLIFDVFAAHRTDSLRNLIAQHNMKVVFVPASCTGELQPLDVSVNDKFKDLMKEEFTKWYSEAVKAGLDAGTPIDGINVDLRMSAIKPVHARRLICALDELKNDKATIMRGFDEPGISTGFYHGPIDGDMVLNETE